MKISTWIILGFVACGLSGCDSEEFAPKALPPFSNIQSNGAVTFKLVNGPDNRVVSTSMAENYYSVSGNTLTVNGGGTMTVAVRDLDLLWCNACEVNTGEPLVVDTLNLYIHGGRATLRDLQVTNLVNLTAMNTGTYKLSGTAGFFSVTTVNTASIQSFGLVTDSTYVYTTSIADVEVTTTQVLQASISSIGDVIYRGNPPVVRVSGIGSGKAIPD